MRLLAELWKLLGPPEWADETFGPSLAQIMAMAKVCGESLHGNRKFLLFFGKNQLKLEPCA